MIYLNIFVGIGFITLGSTLLLIFLIAVLFDEFLDSKFDIDISNVDSNFMQYLFFIGIFSLLFGLGATGFNFILGYF